MKNKILSILVLTATIIFSGCGSNHDKLIGGTWKPNYKANLDYNIEQQNKEMTDTEYEYALKQMKSVLPKMSFSFSESKMTSHTPPLPPLSVSYEILSEKDDVLEIKTEENKIFNLQILSSDQIAIVDSNKKIQIILERN